ncbi:hypothetical protein HID58_032753 [Brassica napus]|uniref:Myosin-1-3 N-terminal SH3 domain-containing protein n=1 Tax=Brassica napus TaxID=3708 RepID=A0ABQ8BX84_BRANA|nr:hypothetical protein HID58_032753 [Brassica napus]
MSASMITARCDVATKSADSVNAESDDLLEEEIEVKAKTGREAAELLPSTTVTSLRELLPSVSALLSAQEKTDLRRLYVEMKRLNEWNMFFLVDSLRVLIWELGKIQSTSAERSLVMLSTSNAVKVFTEELVPANPDILEDTWKTDEGPQGEGPQPLGNVVTTDLLRLIKIKKTC